MKKLNVERLISIGARGVASIADQGASAAVGFLASVFIGRFIGAEALGIYAITNVFVMLIRAVQNSLILEPMSVFGAQRRSEEKSAYFGYLIRIEAIWIGLLVLIFMACAAVAGWLGIIEPSLSHALMAGGGFTFFFCYQYLLRRQFYIELHQYLAMTQSLFFLLLISVGAAAMSFFDGWTVVDVYIMFSICSIVVCVVQGGRFWNMIGRPDDDARRRYNHEHWSYGKWLLLAVPLGNLTYQGYFFIVGVFVSTEAAGLLKAVDTLVAPFFQVSIGLSLMLTPMVARNIDRMTVAAQARYALKISAPLLGLGILYSGFIFFAGEFVLRALFGEQIAGAFPLIGVMSVVPIFATMGMPASVILAARRLAKLRFVTQAFAVAGTLLVGVPLVIMYGLMGAAFGFILTGFLFTVGQWGCLAWVWRRQSRGLPAPQPNEPHAAQQLRSKD